MIRAAATLALALFTTAPALAAPGWSVTFDGAQAKARSWMKANGWEEQRGSAKAWSIRDGALHTRQDENSTTIGTSKGFPLDPAVTPRIKMRFRVSSWPQKGDLRRKSTEDAALRVFVLFDHGGGLLSPPDTLGYAFTSSQPLGKTITSQRFDNVKFIPVATAQGYAGGWVEVERDLAADYKAAFGRKAPRIKAIGIKSDANNTDGRAAAIIDSIEILPR